MMTPLTTSPTTAPTTIDRAQRIPVPGTVNFREVTAGGHLRPGLVYRSDALSRLGEAGRAELLALGVRRVVDLRSADEMAQAPDDLAGLDLETVHLPVAAGSTADAVRRALAGEGGDLLAAVSVSLLTDGGPTLGAAVRLFADGVPTVVHCTAGKDRTGLAVALLLLAVGVPVAQVVADYARTEQNLAGPWLERMLDSLAARGLPLDDGLRGMLGGSPAATLEEVLDAVVLRDGSPDAYLDTVGVGPQVRAALRSTLLATDPSPDPDPADPADPTTPGGSL